MNSAFGNIKAITKRELTGYFASPVAYVFIVIFLLLCGFFTFMAGGFFERDQASLVSFFMWHPWFYMFLVPAVGMRLWAEERRVGTLELLLTMPITSLQAIVGKFLASWVFLILALALTFPVWLTVNYLGQPDNGVVVCAYLGSALMSGAYLAIACMTSAMTRNQVVAFILSVVICLFLILAGWPPVTQLVLQINPKSPWLLRPYCLVSFWVLFAVATNLLNLFSRFDRKLTYSLAAMFALLSATPASVRYLQAIDGPVWAIAVLAGLALIFQIVAIALVFRSLSSPSLGLRVLLSVVIGVLLLNFFAIPWFVLVTIVIDPPGFAGLISNLSVMTHFEAFQRGVIDFRDLVFFLSLIGFALFTTGVILRSHRSG